MAPHAITYQSIDDLVLSRHPDNAKAHDIPGIRASMERFGFVAPLIVDRGSRRLVAGHGRLEALLAIRDADEAPPRGIEIVKGDWLVPVIDTVSFADSSELEAYLLADNQLTIAGGWSEEMLLASLQRLSSASDGLVGTGFSAQAMVDLLDRQQRRNGRHVGLTDEDDAPALPDVPMTQPGDIWRLGDHRIICGDSREPGSLARLMGGSVADIVWTDPPYGVAVGDKNKYLNSVQKSRRVEENILGDSLDDPALTDLLNRAFANAIDHCRGAHPGM